MTKKKAVFIVILVTAVLIPLMMVNASKIYDFTSKKVRIIKVPYEWGEPVNVAGGRGRVIVMFEDGHIIVLARWLWVGNHLFKLERVKS